jgi:sugar lactone lactonase YvrE
MQTWTVTKPYLNIHCELGEAPYYEAESNTLRFVDIKKKQLHTLSLDEGPESLKTLQLDMPVGVTADIEGVDYKERILVGGKSGIYILDRRSGKYELLKRFYETREKDERLRSNDGAVDPQGRFWIGTMNDFWVGEPQAEGEFESISYFPVNYRKGGQVSLPFQREFLEGGLRPRDIELLFISFRFPTIVFTNVAQGTLFRFNSDLTRHTIHTSLIIPNGVGWSRDQKTLYFTNSTAKKILSYTYNASDGSLSNEKVFWQHSGSGDPDGFKFDSEGYIWQAIYGEGKVIRISPEGKEVGEVRFPTNNITCPVFVGTELWVTSADEEDESQVESKKFGGDVFRVDVGIGGLQDFKFKLEENAKTDV